MGSASPLFQPGDVIADRYAVARWIASGGMGEVFEGDDALTGTRVALKTLGPSVAGVPENVERLRRELVLARRLQHPSICRVFDLGQHQPDPARPPVVFFTMELLHGETLGERLARQGPLDAAEAAQVLQAILEGLDALHGEGILHRDLKSDNIFLARTPEGTRRVVITDFGVALDIAGTSGPGLTRSGVLVGTLEYASPEQLEGAKLTARSDLYSVGILVHEMLTGARPFSGASPFSEAARRLFDDPAPIGPSVALGAEVLAAVARRCLERDPSRRFASAREALAALRSSPPAAPVSARRRGRGRPARVAAWGAAALAAAGLAVALAWPSIRPKGRELPATRNAAAYEFFVRGKARRDLEGLALLQRAVELDPSYVPAWTALAASYLQSTAPHLLGRRGYQGAEQALGEALRRDGANREARLLLPIVLVETGRAADAVRRLEALRRSEPGDADVLWNLSYAYRYLGVLDTSRELGLAALRRDPRIREDASWAFNTLLYLGRTGEFLDSLPARVDSYTTFYRGLASLHAGAGAEAARLFAEAYALDRTSVYGQIGKAIQLGIDGDRARGLLLLDAVWSADRKARAVDGETLYKLHQAYWALGRKAEASEVFSAVIDRGFLCVACFASDPLTRGFAAVPGAAELLERAETRRAEALESLGRTR